MAKTVSKIGTNPLDFIGQDPVPLRAVEARAAHKEALTIAKTYRIAPEMVEKVADAAYAERCTVSALVTQAIRELITRLEARRGEPYPSRPKESAQVPSTL